MMGPTLAQSHIILEDSAMFVNLSVCNICYVLTYSDGCDHMIVLTALDVADNSQV